MAHLKNPNEVQMSRVWLVRLHYFRYVKLTTVLLV